MKTALLFLALVATPGLAHAGGLIDTTPIEKSGRDAQKKLKGDVDGSVDKHHVTVGSDDAKKSGKKAKKKAAK
jgi:hypothetical protein